MQQLMIFSQFSAKSL